MKKRKLGFKTKGAEKGRLKNGTTKKSAKKVPKKKRKSQKTKLKKSNSDLQK